MSCSRDAQKVLKPEPSPNSSLTCVKYQILTLTSQNFWREVNLKLILHPHGIEELVRESGFEAEAPH